jgi:FKBP-type peptidyl-prolyl cis-trans isomerase 2
MTQVKKGDTVKVHFHGTLEDGTVFDSTYEDNPIEFKIGEGQIIEGFENAVEGMSIGEVKNILVPSQEAYGAHHEENMVTINRSDLPEHIAPEQGKMLQLTTQDNQTFNVTVTSVSDDTVTLDANHPLAGKDLNFEIKVVEVV